jgi:hypothetical protein
LLVWGDAIKGWRGLVFSLRNRASALWYSVIGEVRRAPWLVLRLLLLCYKAIRPLSWDLFVFWRACLKRCNTLGVKQKLKLGMSS